jgi:hypothetical protein
MDIICQLSCPCNQKIYKNNSTLKAHQKTQGHLFWESGKEQKDTIIKINRLENENEHLRRLNVLLMERVFNLEKNKC